MGKFETGILTTELFSNKPIPEETTTPKDNTQPNIDNSKGNTFNPNSFFDLKNEFDKLNNHINIDKFLSSLKELNIKMERSKSSTEKFQNFYQFINNLTRCGF